MVAIPVLRLGFFCSPSGDLPCDFSGTRHAAESDQPIHYILFYLDIQIKLDDFLLDVDDDEIEGVHLREMEQIPSKQDDLLVSPSLRHRHPILLGLPLAQITAACRAVSFLCAPLHLPLLLRYPPPSPFLSPSAHGTRDENNGGDATEAGAAAKVAVQAPSSYDVSELLRDEGALPQYRRNKAPAKERNQ
ncbi:hypothetical protein B0H19DRAFT_1086498 [Mycena capillaripes]|nr:hypothetical protein B0H19DRAFT_1086498 [Mycena capillaripes]